jgi:hypothetical protein
MVWNQGEQSEIYDAWTPAVANVLWGDQDWIGQCCPDAAAMPLEWFPRLSSVDSTSWSAKSKVVLCKKPKNAEALVKYPWFNELWQ